MVKSSGRTAWLRRHVANDRVWRLADAEGQVLGRLASQIAVLLRGKHKPTFLDNVFCGDPVVVINATEFELTGRKATNKRIVYHTGRPGGLKRRPVQAVLARRPTHPLRLAVKRMLAPNRLREVLLDNLHLYPGPDHPHATHDPAPLPPAHVGRDVGAGRPPPVHHLETWWLDQACLAPDHVLAPVVDRVRQAYRPPMSRGLADLLLDAAEDARAGDGPGAAAAPGRGPGLRPGLRAYVDAVEAEKERNPAYPAVVPL